MSSRDHEALSRLISHALRHEPWVYELELDDEGWVSLDQLIAAVRREGGAWGSVNRADIEAMLASSVKQRHELDGARIRATYGHSLPGRLSRDAADPPARLLHGTTQDVVPGIFDTGLQPMGRQYVHLSVDRETALAVGRRKAETPVILAVAAREAHAEGVAFYRGNDHVWLADEIPSEFIAIADAVVGGPPSQS